MRVVPININRLQIDVRLSVSEIGVIMSRVVPINILPAAPIGDPADELPNDTVSVTLV
jgi:hypothetical protein